MQYRGPSPVARTVVLADRKVFVTPMEDGLRVGGTVEIGGPTRPPDPRRGALLARGRRETFAASRRRGDDLDGPSTLHARFGAGVGAAEGFPGLLLAVGHGHLGLTDSVNTAERIAAGMCGRSIADTVVTA